MKKQNVTNIMLSRPRGTLAEYGGKARLLDITTKHILDVLALYSVSPIYLPTFEYESLFRRTIGDDSDIVNKELYSFVDRKGRNLSLRPEGTAGVMRLVLEQKLIRPASVLPLKFYYCGPMFRYERPQNQRRREFMQVGVEYLGGNSAASILELLQIVHHLLAILNLSNAVKICVNTIGKISDRKLYAAKVRKYFQPHFDNLCTDCQIRYHKNIFRIADCKNEQVNLIAEMPSLYNVVENSEKVKLDELIAAARTLGIDLKYDNKIVRGLDYYDSIVFEVICKRTKLSIIAGGCYDQLAHKLKPQTDLNACGFAIGLERLAMVWWEHCKTTKDFVNQHEGAKFFVYGADKNKLIFTALVCKMLREQGYIVMSSSKPKMNITKLYDSCLTRGYRSLIYFCDKTDYYDESGVLQHVKVFNLAKNIKTIVAIGDLLPHLQTMIVDN